MKAKLSMILINILTIGTFLYLTNYYNISMRKNGHQTQALVSKYSNNDIFIFYHIYMTENKTNETRLIVEEQMQTINEAAFKSNTPFHVGYTSIGVPVVIHHTRYTAISSIQKIQYLSHGNEMQTLQSLHQFCLQNPTNTIIYIHGKGSFHFTKENTLLRKMLMYAIFSSNNSNGCLQRFNTTHLPYSCNVCGARFSPVPHHHFPGNMWMAHCSYIKHLISPSLFEQQMNEKVKLALELSRFPDYSSPEFGLDRFSAEHWVSSHPNVIPCDVYKGPYVWTYKPLPQLLHNEQFDLHVAPRFNERKYIIPGYKKTRWDLNWNSKIDGLLYQYITLYSTIPPNGSWIWNFARFGHI